MFRKLRPEDRNTFLEMTRDFYSSPAVLHPIPEENHEALFEELMRSGDYVECFIIEQDGQIVGYAQISKTYSHEAGGSVVWLEELYVVPQFRGKGLGGKFLDELTRSFPAARFRLETEPENLAAAALYRRHGFKPLSYVQYVIDKKQ